MRIVYIQYSYDCSSFQTYTEHGGTRYFSGNWDADTIVSHAHHPVWARCLRYYTYNWEGTTPSLRLEVYGYDGA